MAFATAASIAVSMSARIVASLSVTTMPLRTMPQPVRPMAPQRARPTVSGVRHSDVDNRATYPRSSGRRTMHAALAIVALVIAGCSGGQTSTAPAERPECAGASFADCSTGLTSALAAAPDGSFVAICDHGDGTGEIVIVTAEAEATEDCEGELLGVVPVD